MMMIQLYKRGGLRIRGPAFFLAFFFLAFFLGAYAAPGKAFAHEEKGHDYGTITGNRPDNPLIGEYSRTEATAVMQENVRSQVDLDICQPGSGVTCRDFVPAGESDEIPAVRITCGGNRAHPGDGGWQTGPATGSCWRGLTVCYGDGSPGNCTSLAGSPPAVRVMAHGCATPDSKGACIENHGSGAVTGNTGDDMFRVNDGAAAFFEYAAVGDMSDPYRLNFIARHGGGDGKGLVMPSGPRGDWSDFKGFVDRPPPFIQIDEACYPVSVALCNPHMPDLPAIAGACGPAARGGALAAMPVEGLCDRGQATAVSGTGPWTWSCHGWQGGAGAECQTEKTKSEETVFGSTDPDPDKAHAYVYDLSDLDVQPLNRWPTSQRINMNSLTAERRVPDLELYASSLNIKARDYSLGFPGYPHLQTFFGVCYDAGYVAPVGGRYVFSRDQVDDGLYVEIMDSRGNWVWVIDDQDMTPAGRGPGNTTVMTRKTQAITLAAGTHRVRIRFYQAWPSTLGAQLFVKPPGGTEIVMPLSGPPEGKYFCP